MATAMLACLLISAGGIALLASRRSQPSLPRVYIAEPKAGDEFIAGSPALVYGRAEDPDGVVQAELWINGELAATQVNAGGKSS